MTAPATKALRDLWRERTRSLLVVLAIALGIAGFESVLSAYAILTRELNRGYLATGPASAVFRTDAIDDALVREVLANPAIAAAEPRRTVSGRIKAGPAQWRNLQLFVVKNYADIRIARLQPDGGAWPPAAGEILIERDAFQVARTRIGESVLVRTPRSKEQLLRVSGSVHDVGQAQARMENVVYGYITLETLQQLGEAPFLDQLNILVAQNPFDEDHIRAVASQVKDALERRGHPVRALTVPPPGRHPHASIMGLLLLAMSSFGFCILALSGILVVNLLLALMASQVREVGVMKTLGGSRAQIAAIYLGQALLLGGAALVIALPAGLWGARELCRYMAVFLNFDIASFAVPAWVFLLVAAAGIAVPLLAAAIPVWRSSSVSIREALADFGVSAEGFGTGAMDRLLAGTGGRFRPVLLAVRNSFRQRNRLALTVATLAAGGLFFLSALNIRASLVHTLDEMFATSRSDLSVRLAALYRADAVDRAARKTPGVVEAESWIVTEGGIPRKSDPPPVFSHGGGHTASGGFAVVALPPDTRLLKLKIAQGRALVPGDTDAIVVNSALAASDPRMQPGNTVSLRVGPAQLSWRVVGIASEPFSPPVAYISKPWLEKLGGHGNMANTVRLRLANTNSIDAVRSAFDRNLEAEDMRAVSSSTKAESRFGFDEHMLMIYEFLIVASCLIGGIGGLGLMTTMSLNVLDRRREMGVLRAIGATPAMVWLIVVTEGVVTGVMSWVIAALAAWPAGKALGSGITAAMFHTGLDFRFELAGLAIWLAVSILLGIAASFVPAWHASRLTVREALAYN